MTMRGISEGEVAATAMVLVVDDSPAMRAMCEKMLVAFGYQAVVAEDAFIAIGLVESGLRPDLILLDQEMPGRDGLAALPAFLDLLSEVPIIMMTAHGSIRLATEFMRAGGQDFIEKPFYSELLDLKIRRTLQDAQTRRRLKLAEIERDAARRARALMQTFVDKISHELVTPGHHIRAAVEFSRQGFAAGDYAKVATWLQVISDAAERFSRLAGDALELARMRRGVPRLSRTPVNLADIAAGAVLAASATNARRVDIVTEVPAFTVVADKDRLAQVFTNLIDNALRHASDGGCVRVSAAADGAMVACTVEDDGPGVPPDLQEQIFEEFFQGPCERTVSGTLGLGLAICREIVRLQGGTITVGRAQPHGARFTFTIPATC